MSAVCTATNSACRACPFPLTLCVGVHAGTNTQVLEHNARLMRARANDEQQSAPHMGHANQRMPANRVTVKSATATGRRLISEDAHSAQTSKDLLMALFLNTGKTFSAQSDRPNKSTHTHPSSRYDIASGGLRGPPAGARNVVALRCAQVGVNGDPERKSAHCGGGGGGGGEGSALPWEIARDCARSHIENAPARTKSW